MCRSPLIPMAAPFGRAWSGSLGVHECPGKGDERARRVGRLAQEGRDVEIVVGDLERAALALVHPDVAIATARAGLLTGAARPCPAVVEARGDHGHADVVA